MKHLIFIIFNIDFFAISLRPSSCIIRQQFKNFNFLMKTARLMLNLFDVKHLYGMRNFNCDSHGSTTPRNATGRVKINQTAKFLNISFFTSTHVREKLNDVHEALYHSCEILGSGVQSLRLGPYDHILSVLNRRKAFSLLPYTFEIKRNAWFWFSWSPLPKLWNSWSAWQGFRP